ncbi:MAG: terminase family protein, partial [Candidatus Riesia sp.]|nr:terminase family protein [Candidatus Riesia sp.]
MSDSRTIQNTILKQYVQIIKGLHRFWEPHAGQIAIGKALLKEKYQYIFAKCGRNFGKTDLVAYLLWRYAMMNPGSENYYFSPLQKQTREIVWASKRIQSFGPREWLLEGKEAYNNTEMRIKFLNGSFIKLDGSDNIDSYRGVKPKGLSVFDEFKDFRSEFYDAYDPNLAAHKAPLIIIGTPPEIEDHHFYRTEDEFKRNEKKKYFEFTSYDNPHMDPSYFDDKREEYYARGEGDVFEREYMVKRVFGGKNSIFPMLDKSMVQPYEKIKRERARDWHKLVFSTGADPGTATCFAVLIIAIDPCSKMVYCLDEIYEKDQAKTSARQIGKRYQDKKLDINPRVDWVQTYDEAAAWFNVEYAEAFDDGFTPTSKAQNKKEDGLSLIKDIMLANKLVISDRCTNLFNEMLNYIRDDKGKIPKVNDHLIDCLRYALAAVGYSLTEELSDFERIKRDPDIRAVRISDEFPGLDDFGDFTDDELGEFQE